MSEDKRSTLREKHIQELEDKDVWVGATTAAKELNVSRQSVYNFYRRRKIGGIWTDAGLLLDKTHAGYRELVSEGVQRKARQAVEDTR